MGTSNSGFISPQQYAQEAATAKAEKVALWDTINQASEEMVAAQSSQANFIPGTSETATSLQVKRLGELEAQQRAQKVAAASNWEALSITLGQDLASLAEAQRGISTKIQKDASVSIFEDPLLALANAFTLPWDQQELEGVTQKIDTTKKAMDAVNSHVQQSAKTAEAIKTSVTAATIDADTAAVANLFTAKGAAARIEALKTRAHAVDDILHMDSLQLDAYMKKQQLDDQAEARSMRKQQFDRQMKIFDRQQKELDDRDAAEAGHLALVNEALVAEGKNPLSVESFKLYKGTSAALLDELTKKGLQIRMQGRDNYSHGATIEERFKWQQTVGWQPDPQKPQQMTAMLWQNQARNAAAEATKNKSLIPVNAEASFATKWKQEQEEIREGSPFRLPSAKVYAAQSSLMKHPIWQKYITPTLNETSANAPLSEEVLLKAATNAILAREVSSSKAAEFIKSVVDQGILLNNTVLEFEKIAGRKQTKYGYRVASGFGIVGKTSYNLADPVEVEAALQGSVVREMGLAGRWLVQGINKEIGGTR